MDQLMYVVTFVALALAIGMSVVAARLLRGHHERSVARAAALEHAAMSDDEFTEAMAADAYHMDPEPEIALRYDDAPSRNAAMFAATEEPPAPGRRWVALATVALVMAALIGGGYWLLKPAALGAAATGASARPTAPGPVTASSAAPIELLSLKHTSDAGAFTITGLVQDPSNGEPLTRVTVVVYLFDNDGAYFTTGRATLEFTGLRPGETSPFLVKIPTSSRVARYRIGFRRDDGSVIAHVDRRGQAPSGMTAEGQ